MAIGGGAVTHLAKPVIAPALERAAVLLIIRQCLLWSPWPEESLRLPPSPLLWHLALAPSRHTDSNTDSNNTIYVALNPAPQALPLQPPPPSPALHPTPPLDRADPFTSKAQA